MALFYTCFVTTGTVMYSFFHGLIPPQYSVLSFPGNQSGLGGAENVSVGLLA